MSKLISVKHTRDDILRVLLETNFNIESSSLALGVSSGLLRKHINNDEVLRNGMSEIIELINDRVESVLIERALKGHFPSMKFYLESRARDRGYGIGRDEKEISSLGKDRSVIIEAIRVKYS